MSDEHELEMMRSSALRNAQSVLAARQRAEEELMAAQHALRRASERMENMLESLSDGFCAVDRDWRITYINGRALEMIAPLDKHRAGLVGRRLWDEFEDLHGTSVAQDCLRAMERRETVVRDFFYRRLGCWLEMRLHPSPDGLTLYFQDITGRKLDQQALVENNTRLQVALAAGRLGDWRWDAASDRVLLGARAGAILGLPSDTPLPWLELRARLHPEQRTQVERAVVKAFELGTDLDVECRVDDADAHADADADHAPRWVALVGRPDYAEAKDGGTLAGITGVLQDISDRKRVETALRDESHVLELLNSTGSILASTRDLRSLLRAATEAAAGVSGARYGAFYHHGGGEGEATLFSLSVRMDAATAGFEQIEPARAADAFGPALRTRTVLRVGDATRDPAMAGLAPRFAGADAGAPVRSLLAVPVVAPSGELLGSMLFGHPDPGVFTERSERIVSGIAAQAAIAVDNARLYEATARAAEERKVLLDSEREARAEAERSSQMKDEFLATLSHELRTPLSAILGWSQVLRRGSRDGADLQRGLQTIERNARAQAQLIEDLLDMSRITSGKVLLDMQAVNPASFIDAAIETVRPAADAKQIALEKHYDANAGGLLVAGDSGRLQQVVWNLLSNAIKFTAREGSVAVSIERGQAQDADSVAITVRDNGAGIRPEFITHVFERFRQEDASMTRRHGGLGLGLSIVKHLVEQHGGTVRAESAGEGKGASFTIELPMAQAPGGLRARRLSAAPLADGGGPGGPGAAAPPPEPVLRDLGGLTVLVVDDDRDSRELIARILTDCHARVRIASSAREAFEALQAAPPDVLISDLGMPEVDGFELIGWVRALPREAGGQVPAIALTAFARSEDRLKALEAGFSSHISKPVEPSELTAAVSSVRAPATRMVAEGGRGHGP